MSKTLTDITAQLETPFDVADIDLLPKSQIEKDGKTLCMALPYADPRVYQDRLNKVAPGEWSTPPPIALAVGQKIVVYVTVTICGLSHTDVGEASATSENAATESYAQAFKRACSQFGLGRYLYDLEKEWVPYNKQRKQIDLSASGIQETVRKMYVKAHIPSKRTPDPQDSVPATEQQKESIRNLCQVLGRDELLVNALNFPGAKRLIAELSEECKTKQAEAERKLVPLDKIPLVSQLHKRCDELFGPDKWDGVQVRLFTHTIPDDDMTPEHCQRMHRSFEIVAAKRGSPEQAKAS
jgi:hypothetical protein